MIAALLQAAASSAETPMITDVLAAAKDSARDLGHAVVAAAHALARVWGWLVVTFGLRTSLLGVLGVLAAAALWRAIALSKRTGIGLGQAVLAADTYAGTAAVASLAATDLGLRGKPDYLVRRRGKIMPIELKPNRKARRLSPGDEEQLGAYLLLLRSRYRNGAASEGEVRYAHAAFTVRLTSALEGRILDAMARIRAIRHQQDVPRSHDDAFRCSVCAVRAACGQALEGERRA